MALTGHIQQWVTLTHQILLCSSSGRQIADKKRNTKEKRKKTCSSHRIKGNSTETDAQFKLITFKYTVAYKVLLDTEKSRYPFFISFLIHHNLLLSLPVSYKQSQRGKPAER